MKNRSKLIVVGFFIGSLGPLAVLFMKGSLYFFDNHGSYQGFLILLFPSSLALMTTEYMSVFSGYVFLVLLSFLNMVMYGVVGFISGLLIEKLSKFTKLSSRIALLQEKKEWFFYSIIINAVVLIGMLILFEFVILYLLYGINIFRSESIS